MEKVGDATENDITYDLIAAEHTRKVWMKQRICANTDMCSVPSYLPTSAER